MTPQMYEMWNKAAYTALACVIGGTAVIAITWPRAEPPSACTAPDIAARILVDERPQMGPLERRMWVDVLVKHYGARGFSPALGASLLATENQFKTYRTSSAGAQGAFQVMPGIWKGTPECAKDANLFEVEVAAECSARILQKYLKDCKDDIACALRRYNAGPYGEARAQQYADQIIARLARASAQCPAFKSLLTSEVPK